MLQTKGVIKVKKKAKKFVIKPKKDNKNTPISIMKKCVNVCPGGFTN